MVLVFSLREDILRKKSLVFLKNKTKHLLKKILEKVLFRKG